MVTKICVRTSKTTWPNKLDILGNYRHHCLPTEYRKCISDHVIRRDLQGDSRYTLRRRDWRGNRKAVVAGTVPPWKNGGNDCSSMSRIKNLTDMPIKELNRWTACFNSGPYGSSMNLMKLTACLQKHRNCSTCTKTGISTSNICYFHIGQCLNGQTRTVHTLARMSNTRDCCLALNLSGQEISLRSIGKRHKSSESFFKRLANKFFQDKTLQAKVDNLKAAEAKLSALKVQQDMKPTKALIGELLYGCSSSKHLLDFIAPWIETGKVTLDEVVTVIEQLQYLVYTEMKEPYPNFVYGRVTDMYYNLQLMQVDDTVFSAIHGHMAFRAMCEYLKLETDALTKAQFASCFSCLLHLGVSRYDRVMTRFYIRLMDTDHEGYSLIDIMHLSNVSHLHYNPVSLTAEYVHPKLSECLKVIESQAMDLKPLRAILYMLGENFNRPLRKDETVCLYSQLYKCCAETGCLDDLSSASELLGFLYRQFIVHKHFISSVPVYFKLNEIHGENIIQKMLDMCLAKVEKNVPMLTPLDIYFLSFMRIQDTRLHKLVNARVKFLLEHRMNQLSLPELIWLLSMYVRFNPEPKIIAAIRGRLNALDLPNLALFLRCVQVTETSCDIIGKKIIDFVDDVFNHKRILQSAIKFDWAIWIKHRHSFNMDFLDVAFQEHLSRVYKESYIGLRKSYAVTVLMTLLRRRQLQSSSVHLLNELSADGSIFQNLKPGQIYVILKELTVSASEGGQVCDLLSDDADKALYESFIFLTLFKTLAAFHRSFDRLQNPNIYLISKTMDCLYMHSKIDVLVQCRVLGKLSISTIQGIDELIKTCHCFNRIDIMRERNNPYRQQFLNNLVTFVIKNSELLSVHDWATVSHVLAHYGYCLDVDENDAFLKLLENTIVKEFAVDSSFLSFLIDCWSLGVDTSKALKIIFSKEYLHELDQRVFIGILLSYSLILHLLRECCSLSSLHETLSDTGQTNH